MAHHGLPLTVAASSPVKSQRGLTVGAIAPSTRIRAGARHAQKWSLHDRLDPELTLSVGDARTLFAVRASRDDVANSLIRRALARSGRTWYLRHIGDIAIKTDFGKLRCLFEGSRSNPSLAF
jgi:hypothetical protein